MMRKPSSGVAPAAVILTSAAAMSWPGVDDFSVSCVRMNGVSMMPATTSANSPSFDPK